MKKINENFEITEGSVYDLSQDGMTCKITSPGVLRAMTAHAVAEAYAAGSRAEARADRSWAVAYAAGSRAGAYAAGSRAEACAAGSWAEARAAGSRAYQYADRDILANDGNYELYRFVDTYYAGCHGPFTLKQALAHWDREDDRACLFTIALGLMGEAE